jgi:hypothetical protein
MKLDFWCTIELNRAIHACIKLNPNLIGLFIVLRIHMDMKKMWELTCKKYKMT